MLDSKLVPIHSLTALLPATMFNVTGMRVSSLLLSYLFDFIKFAHLMVKVNFLNRYNTILKCLLLDKLWRCQNKLVLGTSTSVNIPTLLEQISIRWDSISRFNPKFFQACPFLSTGPPLPLDDYVPDYAFDHVFFVDGSYELLSYSSGWSFIYYDKYNSMRLYTLLSMVPFQLRMHKELNLKQ